MTYNDKEQLDRIVASCTLRELNKDGALNKLFHTASIEHLENENCSDDEQAQLLDVFELTMKKMATTRARKSWYELRDYAIAKEHGLKNFELVVERLHVLGQEQFHGTFEWGNKKLFVLGTLEDESGLTL